MGGFNQHGAQRRIGGSDQARVGLPDRALGRSECRSDTKLPAYFH